MKKLLATIAIVGLLTGCATLFKTIVTITDVRNSVMNELGAQYRAGHISADVDAKITSADQAYRAAAASAQLVLETYKVTGQGDTTASILAVKNAVTSLVDILATYTDATVQYKQLATATKL